MLSPSLVSREATHVSSATDGRDHRAIEVLAGARLSRRSFLQAVALTGVATLGVAGGVLGAARPAQRVGVKANQAVGGRIDDLAASLGYDIEAIFRFVSENIRYDPYSGVLRGPLGTLASRAGNSADQATLIAALLDASFIPHRFAWGPLEGRVVEQLASAAVADIETVRQEALQALSGTLPGEAARVVDPETEAALDDAVDRGRDVLPWAREQLDGTVSELGSILSDAGIVVAGGFSALPEQERGRHIWVQASRGPAWLDLDPTLPVSTVGDAFAEPETTIEALPEDLFHNVELAVVGETLRDRALETTPLLRVGARAHELAGAPITLLNTRPEGIAGLAELIRPVSGRTTYAPMLVIGGEGFVGEPMRFGRSEEAEGGLFDEEFLGGAELDAEITAEWIEMTVRSPERDPVVVRRAVFDRIGPAARSAGSLDPAKLQPVNSVDLGPGSENELLPARATSWLMVSTGLPSASDDVVSSWDPAQGQPAIVAQAHHLARELAGLELALPAGARPFQDGPNVTAYTASPRTATDDEQVVDYAIDILHRTHGVVPVEGASAEANPMMLPGILAHVAERVVAGDATASGQRTEVRPAASVGAVFDAARSAGIGAIVLSTVDEAASLDIDADARTRLERSLANGWLAVVPDGTVNVGGEDRTGWWLIDPESGRVSDELDDGRGAAEVEYAETLMLVSQTAARARAFRCAFGGALAMEALLLTIVTSGLAGYAAAKGNTAGLVGALGASTTGLGTGVIGTHILGSCL